MSRRIFFRVAVPLVLAAAFLPLTARAQYQDSQSDSVAEAARRAREKKKAAAKPANLVTEDNLKPAPPSAEAPAPPAPVASSERASPSAAPATTDLSAASAPSDSGSVAPAPPANGKEADDEKTKESAELNRLKAQLAEAQKDLDLLQRDEALQEDTYYSKPDHDRDPAGKTKLDQMKQQIADKAQDLTALKARVAELEAAAGTTPPAQPPQ